MAITWSETIDIQAPIEQVWDLFSLENQPKIMPGVIATKPLEIKEGGIGSTYLQTYREGKKTMEYVVEDLDHHESPDMKYNQSGFTLAKMFSIKVAYLLEKLDDVSTRFTYSGSNEGINWLGKLMLKVMPKSQNQKVVLGFVDRVKNMAEGTEAVHE